MPKAKGTIIVQRIQYLDEKCTPDQKKRVLAMLNPEFQKHLQHGLLAVSWYDFSWLVELLLAMDKVIGRGDLSLIEEIGHFAGMKAGTGIYHLFFKLGSVRFLLERAPMFWRQLYDTGSCKTIIENDHQGTVHFREFPDMHKVLCLSLKGWCRAVIELSGGKNVDVSVTHWPDEKDTTLSITGKWE